MQHITSENVISVIAITVVVLVIGSLMLAVRLHRLDNLVEAHQGNAEHIREADDQSDTQSLNVVELKIYEARTDMLRQDLNNTRTAYDLHRNHHEYCGSLKAIYKRGDEIIKDFSHLSHMPGYDPLQVGVWKMLAKGEYLNVCGDVQELEASEPINAPS